MKEINWNEISENEWVRLKWTGYHRVPKWLGGNWAKVISRNKAGNLVVQASNELIGYTRTIQLKDISDYSKSNPLA